ncbi:TetR/AcrR family transcriptional regulator [Streptomyces sp. NPDC056529]|uniref:TetR/AcrR family transcriptional regulator n=1 Tax=Streptomyces sp. NPDC056529 TaxID=3345855 RepID=UPI00369F34B6
MKGEHASAPEGLRDRRRRETRSLLRSAALRLMEERGFDEVTVEAVAYEAGVSPRTFFNYFPSKESVLDVWPGTPAGEAAERFAASPRTDLRSVVEDLGDLLAAPLDRLEVDHDEATRAVRIAERSPAVLAALNAGFAAVERDLASLIARRIGRQATEETVVLLAGMCAVAVRTGTMRWAHRAGGGGGAAESVRQSFALLCSLLNADHQH